MEFKKADKELCERTLENLKAIENLKSEGSNVYEVTQLYNSLLGIVVNFKETYSSVSDEHFSSLVLNDFGLDGIELEGYNNTFPEFLRHFRNGISHLHVKFESNSSSKEIESLYFFDSYNNNSPKNWEARFSVEELRIVVTKICEYVQLHASDE